MANLLDITVENYRLIQPQTGGLYALRHGEPWNRDLIGDGFVLALGNRIDELQDRNAELEVENKRLREALERFSRAAEYLERFDHVPGDLYVAVKNEGQGTGWSYHCSGIGCSMRTD